MTKRMGLSWEKGVLRTLTLLWEAQCLEHLCSASSPPYYLWEPQVSKGKDCWAGPRP